MCFARQPRTALLFFCFSFFSSILPVVAVLIQINNAGNNQSEMHKLIFQQFDLVLCHFQLLLGPRLGRHVCFRPQVLFKDQSQLQNHFQLTQKPYIPISPHHQSSKTLVGCDLFIHLKQKTKRFVKMHNAV